MYCSKCGNSVDADLKYCKNCGAKLAEDDDNSPKSMLDGLVTALCVTVVFGLGILVGLVAVLLGNNVETNLVVVIAVVYLFAIFGICCALLSQVVKLINAKLNTRPEQSEINTPVQLASPTTAQLREHFEPASVTEHTTNMLGEVFVERK